MNKLRRSRELRRLSQEDLARLAGVTTKTIQRAEMNRGRRNVSDQSWAKIAQALDLKPSDLW